MFPDRLDETDFMYIRNQPKHGNASQFVVEISCFFEKISLNWLLCSALIYLTTLSLFFSQITRFLWAHVRVSCQREVVGHPHTNPPHAPPSLTPLPACPSIPPKIPYPATGSTCPLPWTTLSESWTSYRTVHRTSPRRTAGRGRSQSSVTPHWPCSTMNTSRSESQVNRSVKAKQADWTEDFLFSSRFHNSDGG